MIINLLINLVALIAASMFSWLPVVTTLPTIVGFDIDTTLVQGVGWLKTFTAAAWPLQIVFQGLLALLVYYGAKMGLKLILGSRAPGNSK